MKEDRRASFLLATLFWAFDIASVRAQSARPLRVIQDVGYVHNTKEKLLGACREERVISSVTYSPIWSPETGLVALRAESDRKPHAGERRIKDCVMGQDLQRAWSMRGSTIAPRSALPDQSISVEMKQ